MTSSFGFTNVTPGTHTATPILLQLIENYALKSDEPTVVELDNKTCPLDQGELVSFKCQDVTKVSSSQEIRNPAKVTTGVQYLAKVEEILRTTSSTDADFVVDEPIIAYLTIRHPKSGNITPDHISSVVERLLGSLMKADGTWRFNELMRSALKPTED